VAYSHVGCSILAHFPAVHIHLAAPDAVSSNFCAIVGVVVVFIDQCPEVPLREDVVFCRADQLAMLTFVIEEEIDRT